MKTEDQIKQEIAQYVEWLKSIKWFSQHESLPEALIKSGKILVFTGETLAAARDAAWDSSLECRMVAVCSDLAVDDTHREHIKLRMDIWRAGWAVFCDVNGVLYVYGIKKDGDK
jgi:hypothetical protein